MRTQVEKLIVLAGIITCLSGCAISASTNHSFDTDTASQASLCVRDKRGNKNVMVLLALSGGGSRAAYFSSSVMLKLQNVYGKEIDLLKEVDAISSVSGGSLASAYYAISKDPGGRGARSNRDWDEKTVKRLMTRDYLAKWIGNWFWPTNILRYWFTAYDRSDIMAQTFQDNLFDVSPTGWELTLGDLNPERPYLIINATDGTENVDGDAHFGKVFSFTREDFIHLLNSDINSYSVARAVMASAAFPGAFNYMTLKDFRDDKANDKRYRHVFDGGNADNLGLTSIETIIKETGRTEEIPEKDRRCPMTDNVKKPQKYVIILVDAYKKADGIDRNDYDPRSMVSYVVDMNFMDTFNTLLDANRRELTDKFHTLYNDGKEFFFWHITFEDSRLNIVDESCTDPSTPEKETTLMSAVNKIPTNFRITDHDARCIDRAVDLLVAEDDLCLKRIKDVLLDKAEESGENPCGLDKSD